MLDVPLSLIVLVLLLQYLTLACGCCPAAQSFAEKPKTKEALDAMRVDTTCLGECGVTRGWRKGRAGGQGRYRRMTQEAFDAMRLTTTFLDLCGVVRAWHRVEGEDGKDGKEGGRGECHRRPSFAMFANSAHLCECGGSKGFAQNGGQGGKGCCCRSDA